MFDYKDIGNFHNCEVRCEAPSNKIYDFNGVFIYPREPGDVVDREFQEALTLENTMWANTVLASQGFVLGLVTYTGKQTRSQMNQKSARSKISLLDLEVNFLSKLLFFIMMIVAFVITLLNGVRSVEYSGMFFMRTILLLSSIIPISLRVNLDLAKLYYAFKVNTDEDIPGSIARNSNIPEDLGRLSFLITDKTGTLTQNEMLLKKVCTEFAIFESDDPNRDFEEILRENCEQFPAGPCNDNLADVSGVQADVSGVSKTKKKKKRDQANNVRDLITAFALCNNVTPVVEDLDIGHALEVHLGDKGRTTQQALGRSAALVERRDIELSPQGRQTAAPQTGLLNSDPRISGRAARDSRSKIILQASSPDEVALVKYSNAMKMELIARERTFVQLRNPSGIAESYDILANFPFSS